MRILGLSAFYHDSAACLLEDGRIVAAAQEERFSRRKHDARFPMQATRYCLDAGGVKLDDIDFIAFYEKPFLKFERLLETYLAFAPRGFSSFRTALPIWLSDKLFQKDLLARKLVEVAGGGTRREWSEKLLFAEHHQSHAASAFFVSPFREALVLTMDGVGEWATTSAFLGSEHRLQPLKELHFPHSLGLLYSAFTYYTGFKVNSGEYKVMGLAPYGEPRYASLILDKLIDLKEDGSFRLDQNYFDYCTGLKMTNGKFHDLFGGEPRRADELLTQKHMDLAASIQAVTEEAVARMVRFLVEQTGQRNLCLAGGVALNCVANGKLLREGLVDDIWVQPAAGDAGGSLGAALAVWHQHLEQPRSITPGKDSMQGAYLGPNYEQEDIEKRLGAVGAKFSVLENENMLLEASVEALLAGKALGWHQGRMEFGPRALGARSILADPRSSSMQKTLNLRIKFRESFRPFAPSVLREEVTEWFDLDVDSPYMLLVAPVAQKRRYKISAQEESLFGIDKLNVSRSEIAAVTHVDFSARVQTAHADTNPLYHRLLRRFQEASGCPVLVNTSFNVRGEPIVNTPEEAFACFMGTDMDALAIGNCFLHKEAQDMSLAHDYKDTFDPD